MSLWSGSPMLDAEAIGMRLRVRSASRGLRDVAREVGIRHFVWTYEVAAFLDTVRATSTPRARPRSASTFG